MFSRRAKGRRGAEPFTYIQEGTLLRGDLEAAGRVRVHGRIIGNVSAAGLLEVAEEGEIVGERVEAEQVRILGSVEADVSASGKVEIWRGGRLAGDVRAASLDIEEGAAFTGRSEMRPAGMPAALPESTAGRTESTAPEPGEVADGSIGGGESRAAGEAEASGETEAPGEPRPGGARSVEQEHPQETAGEAFTESRH